MKSTLIDAGPLIALFDASDRHHEPVKKWLKNYQGKLISTWPVLTEAVHLLSESGGHFELLEWIERGGLELYALGADHFSQILKKMKKYRDLPMDLADGSLLSAAEESGVKDILTLDSDFRVYRIGSSGHFKYVMGKEHK